MVGPTKKLLVLDVNGLLIDTYYEGEARPDLPYDEKVNKFYVYKRPFCDKFIQFCLETFVVGVWSSALEHNVLSLVEFVFKEAKEKLAFIWHQKHCTDTGFRHPENKFKPLFLKELWRLWKKYKSDLPWTEGDYGPGNTLLIDDSAYKALNNPQHTAIFPKTYKATSLGDNYLERELRQYLDGLRLSSDVQVYLRGHPIGEPSIPVDDPHWSQILNSVKVKNEKEVSIPVNLLGIGVPALSNPVHRSRRADPSVPMQSGVTNFLGNEGQARRKECNKDNVWPHLDVFADVRGHFSGRSLNNEFPNGRGGCHWIPGRPMGIAHITGNRISPPGWGRAEEGPHHQRLDPGWGCPDLVSQARGHHESESFGALQLGSGFPQSDSGHPWMSNVNAHLVGSSVEPLPASDWQGRVLPGQPGRESIIPYNDGVLHASVDGELPIGAYEERGERLDHMRGHLDGGRFVPSGLASAFRESNAEHARPPPRLQNVSRLVSKNLESEHGLSASWRRAGENFPVGNGHFTPASLSIPQGGDDAQFRCVAMEDDPRQRPDLVALKNRYYENENFHPPGRGHIFADDYTRAYRSNQHRSDEIPNLIGITPDLQRPENKFANLFDGRFDRSASEALFHPGSAESIPANPKNPLLGGDRHSRQPGFEVGHRDHPHLFNDSKVDFVIERPSPSRWGTSTKDRDPGHFPVHRQRSNEICHLESDKHIHPSDWPNREGMMFGNFLEQGELQKGDRRAQSPSGISVFSDLHGGSGPQPRRVAHESGCKLDFDRGLLGPPSGISQLDAGPSWTSCFKSSNGPVVLEKARNPEYPSLKRVQGRLIEYDDMDRVGDRTLNKFLGPEFDDRKRTRDPEEIGRSWSLERKEIVQSRSRDTFGPRGQEYAHGRAHGWSAEQRDSRRGVHTKFSREGDRELRGLGSDGHRVSPHKEDERHDGIHRRERLSLKEYEERYFLENMVLPEGDFRREDGQSRGKRPPDRVYGGSIDHRLEGSRNSGWAGGGGGELHYSRNYSQKHDSRDDWLDSRASKRRVLR